QAAGREGWAFRRVASQATMSVVLPKPAGAETNVNLAPSPASSLAISRGRGTNDERRVGVYNFVRSSVSIRHIIRHAPVRLLWMTAQARARIPTADGRSCGAAAEM